MGKMVVKAKGRGGKVFAVRGVRRIMTEEGIRNEYVDNRTGAWIVRGKNKEDGSPLSAREKEELASFLKASDGESLLSERK